MGRKQIAIIAASHLRFETKPPICNQQARKYIEEELYILPSKVYPHYRKHVSVQRNRKLRNVGP